MARANKETIEAQKELIKTASEELSKHTSLIRDIYRSSKTQEIKKLNREILLGIIILFVISTLTLLGKLSGETLASLIGIVIGYFMGSKIL